ncbi:DUF2490 domain-containing protein [Hymenobacter sp. BT175]|uniref:DUF2490 domain-containing protein n=1 Tax=Hymenobacter translucens TaxID=2886507 RepID=UPI001D0F2234|nr:DUF2490 domain-containing protein [Hymenobacter translucens]MCC2548426.1 DUF2490 domain-containing protein [Hymenobacter translucens]
MFQLSHTASKLSGLLLCCCLFASTAQAQTTPPFRTRDTNTNSWLMYFSDARLTERWGVHTEAQVRRARVLRDPLQNFARVGINYYVDKQLMLTGGYGYFYSYPYGDYPAVGNSSEHRIYQQALVKSSVGRSTLLHRYRLEQRWVLRPNQTEHTYLNRARYMARLVLPFKGSTLDPGTPFLALSDEILIGFGKNVTGNIFDQNRAYAALGYQFTKATSVEVGYLHHIVLQGSGRVYESNHTLQLALNFNPDFRRPASTPSPEPGAIPATPEQKQP